jgi:hypothetical protein
MPDTARREGSGSARIYLRLNLVDLFFRHNDVRASFGV